MKVQIHLRSFLFGATFLCKFFFVGSVVVVGSVSVKTNAFSDEDKLWEEAEMVFHPFPFFFPFGVPFPQHSLDFMFNQRRYHSTGELH